MKLKIYKKDSHKYFSINISKYNYVWLTNEADECGQFSIDDITDVIYEALEKFFKDNH